MRHRTLGALGLVVLVGGGLVVASLGGFLGSSVGMSELWVSETARETGGNHHAPAAGDIDGNPMVYAAVSGRSNTTDCALVALDGANGGQEWDYQIPPADCTIHSVADPTLADFDDDGVTEVLTATSEEALVAHHPLTGEEELRYNLTSYGYSEPVVADLTGNGESEVIVVDVSGTVHVVGADGEAHWTEQFSTYTWGQPAVADFDGDGEPELAVGQGSSGEVHVFEGDGSETWDEPHGVEGSITWMTTGQADEDAATEIVVGSRSGLVAAIDGETGEREWTHDFENLAAVRAFGDGDSDGDPEVYAVAADATLRAMDAASGDVEWSTRLTDANVQMMPPPVLGDLDGDGSPELLVATNDGIVSVVDPETGDVLDSTELEATIYAPPTLADVDGDGDLEAFVTYADGRVIAYDFESSEGVSVPFS